MRAKTLATLIVALAAGASAQTNQQSAIDFRPFKPIVEAVSQKPLDRQCEYMIRLSKGLMAGDYAAVTKQKDYPHFGHLASELFTQNRFELIRAMLKEDKLDSYNFFTLAELLAEKCDAETFEILIKHSSPMTPPPKGDEGYNSPEGLVAGEGIPDYAALSICHYLTNTQFHAKAQAHLINILKEHKRTGTRAFAAEALGCSRDQEAINALEVATKDKGRVPCSQCGEDYVYEYAQKALERIKKPLQP